MADRELKVRVTGDSKELEKSLDTATQKTESFGSRLLSLGKAAGALAAASALGAFFKSAIDEASKAEVGMGRLGQAVGNAGGDFSKLRPQLEETVKSVMRVSTATDDDLRESLTRMIAVSGDVAGSQKNLALVTDLAAFKQISLSDASDIVAKAMNGNTTALNKMGIAGKDATTVLENARASFGGFAAREANTFSGTLQRLNNQWGEFQEAVGTAILSGGEMGGIADGLAGGLANLAEWVEQNEGAFSLVTGAIGDAVGALVDVGGTIWETVGPAVQFIGKYLGGALIATLNTAVFYVRLFASAWQYTAGATLDALGWIAEKGGALLKVFGVTVVSEAGASLRAFGEQLKSSAATNIASAANKYQQSWRDLLAGRKTSNADVAAEESRHEGTVTNIARRGQEDRQKKSDDSAERSRAAIEKHNREIIKQLEGLGKQLATERAKQGDEAAAAADLLAKQLKVNLGEASAEALVLTNDAMGKLLETLKGKIPAEQWHALNAELSQHKQTLGDLLPPAEGLAAAAKEAADENKRLAEESESAKDTLDQSVRKGADLARAFIDAASATGIIDDKMANVLNSAISLAASLPAAFAGDPASIAQAVSSLANIIVGVGSSETEKRRAAAAAANTSALDRLTREVGNLNLRESGKTFAGVQSAVDASIQARADARASGKGPGAADEAAKAAFLKSLKSQGIGLEEARGLFKELFGRDMSMANAGTFFQDIQAFSEGLANTEFGQFGTDFEGQLDAITKGFDILGTSDDDEKLKEFQQLAGKFSPLLKDALAGDLSTPEGRAQATANLRELFKKMKTPGALKAEDIGVSGPQFLAMIQTLLPLLAGADGILGDGSSVAAPPTSTALVGSTPALGGAAVVGGAVGGPAFSPGLPTPTVPNAFTSLGTLAGTTITYNIGDLNFNFPDVRDSAEAAEAVAARVASLLGTTYTRQRTALGLAT